MDIGRFQILVLLAHLLLQIVDKIFFCALDRLDFVLLAVQAVFLPGVLSFLVGVDRGTLDDADPIPEQNAVVLLFLGGSSLVTQQIVGDLGGALLVVLGLIVVGLAGSPQLFVLDLGPLGFNVLLLLFAILDEISLVVVHDILGGLFLLLQILLEQVLVLPFGNFHHHHPGNVLLDLGEVLFPVDRVEISQMEGLLFAEIESPLPLIAEIRRQSVPFEVKHRDELGEGPMQLLNIIFVIKQVLLLLLRRGLALSCPLPGSPVSLRSRWRIERISITFILFLQ